VPLVSSEPQQGYYKLKLVKNGPFVPARIYSLDGELRAKVWDGHEVDPLWVWGRCAHRPISPEKFAYMIERIRWCILHNKTAPEVHPWRAIDINQTKVAL
jgi:hypothetical protein